MCPSSINGIVGIKPTVGLWSRSGTIPISHSQDTAGPMTRSVRDAAILLGALTGCESRVTVPADPGGIDLALRGPMVLVIAARRPFTSAFVFDES